MAPLQTDIFNYVDPEASLAPWYLVGKPRKEVKADATWILRTGEIGEFFVRDISSHPGCLGLSIKTSKDDLMNYLLQPHANGAGISVRGTKEVFPTLSKLIAHYASRRRPSLPVQLVEPVLTRKGRKAKRATNGRKSSKQPVAATVDFDEDEEGGFGFDPEPEPKQPEVAPVSGGARRPSRSMTRVERHKEEEEKVTASRVAAAIDSSVKEAVGSRLDDITRQQIDNIEHRIAKRRAMIEKRRLALLQEQGAESKKTLETLEEVFQGRTENAAPPAHRPTQQHPAPPAPAPYTTPMSLEVLERERGSRPVSPAPQRALPDAESVIGDPTAMWDAIVASDATASVKLNAAKKQLLYFQQEELLIQQKLAEAEQTLMRPRHFSENDTVFDDNFENGTIIDDTGEVFGFGAL